MSLVLFLRGMIAVLVVFAATIFLLTGSVWTTFWQTLACAVLIQVGYFVGILLMVWRTGGNRSRTSTSGREADPKLRADDGSTDPAGKLPVAPFTRRP